jgi:uncharacterized protein (TIGR04222 family)
MGPFELRGPEFLLFYAVFAAVVLAALYWMRLLAEPRTSVRLTDPYLIAYLRGGDTEAVRVAALALVDRRLLAIVKDHEEFTLRSAPGAFKIVTHPLECEVLKAFDGDKSLNHAIQHVRLGRAIRAYESELEARQRVDYQTNPGGVIRFGIGVALLLVVSVIKVAIGFSRNRPVSFLVLLTLFSLFAAYRICFGEWLSAHARVLEDLQSLFQQARSRATWFRPGANTGELVAIAAVYGLDEIPASAIPYVADLRDRLKSADTLGGMKSASHSTIQWTWSSGSSCASTGGDGGGSCGGGCGGGCGGCGS